MKESDLYPYCPFEIIRQKRIEYAGLWLNLKQMYPDKLNHVCFSDDEKILDIAEEYNKTNVNLDIMDLLISIVECTVELESTLISNTTLIVDVRKYRQKKDKNIAFKIAEMFWSDEKYNCDKAIACEWYSKYPDEPMAKEKLATLEDKNRETNENGASSDSIVQEALPIAHNSQHSQTGKFVDFIKGLFEE
jgi:hypothetical protein